jgi:hypothetical protein
MKTCGGSGGVAALFLTLALDGCEWSASSSCRFIPMEISPNSHWIGVWVGTRDGLDAKNVELPGIERWPSSP